jgi:hypothetical protein
LKSQKNIRNPYYKTIPNQQVIPSIKAEPNVDEWDEDLIDLFNNKKQKEDRVIKSSRARNRRKEARYAKEDRIYGE